MRTNEDIFKQVFLPLEINLNKFLVRGKCNWKLEPFIVIWHAKYGKKEYVMKEFVEFVILSMFRKKSDFIDVSYTFTGNSY